MRRTALPFLLLLGAACGRGNTGAPSVTYPGVDGHTWFPLAGTAHEPAPRGPLPAVTLCTDCHAADSFAKATDCRTCHFAQIPPPGDLPPHTGNGAYAAAAASGRTDFCRDCHPKGVAGGAGPHTNFPVGPGTTHNRACALCHTSAAGRSTAVADGALNCVTCHLNQLPPPNDTIFPPPSMAERHARVLDYPASPRPMDCLRCHDQAHVDRIAAHGRRPGPAGLAGPGDRPQHDTHCFQCHQAVPPLFRTPPVTTGASPWAQDWKSAACTPCHTGAGN